MEWDLKDPGELRTGFEHKRGQDGDDLGFARAWHHRSCKVCPRGQSIDLNGGTELRLVNAYTHFGFTIARTGSLGMEVAHRIKGMVAGYLPTSRRILETRFSHKLPG